MPAERFINPYQFVPISHEVTAPGQAPSVPPLPPLIDPLPVAKFKERQFGHVTHDRFVPGTYTGRIVCRVTTEDAVVIGGTQRDAKPDAGEPAGAKVVEPFLRDGRPAIPATTLRGMLSSVAEAASHSALRVLSNQYYSVRRAMDQFLPAIGMIVIKNEKGKEQRWLRPVALPAGQCPNNESTSATVATAALRTMFGPQTVSLNEVNRTIAPFPKVYLDGYQRMGGPDGPVTATGFLRTAKPRSYSADHREFWYIQLRGSSTQLDLNGQFTITHPRRPSSNTPFILGQLADGVPIPQAEYDRLSEDAKKPYTRGMIRCLGLGPNDERAKHVPKERKHEIFIPYPPEMEQYPAFRIEDSAWDEFHSLANERTAKSEPELLLPFQVEGASRNGRTVGDDHVLKLRDGDLVYFSAHVIRGEARVDRIALSAIWRQEAGETHDYFPKELLPFHAGRTQITLAEQLFGFVEARDSRNRDATAPQALALASRIRLSEALLDDGTQEPFFAFPNRALNQRVLKILSSPKPPCPTMYFRPKREPGYIPKTLLSPAQHGPNGRKFYVHRNNAGRNNESPWFTTITDPNAYKQKRLVTPLRKGLDFWFHIDFHNLSLTELQLLVYALRPTESFWHKLGLGKSIGLGAVSLTPAGLFFIDPQQRYGADVLKPGVKRYHGGEIALPEPDLAKVPAAYQREFAYRNPPQPNDNKPTDPINPPPFPTLVNLRDGWRALAEANPVLKSAKLALEVIGDPIKSNRPVHTPQIENEGFETDTFQWFAANDKKYPDGHPQYLEPVKEIDVTEKGVTKKVGNLPKLDR